MRLIDHLKALGLSNREARAAMESGKVVLNGLPTRDGGRMIDPDDVALRPAAPRMVVGRDVMVLYKDAHLAVIYKPSGMLSVPAPRREETDVLAEVAKILGTALPVHRLDEGTSGLMMVALSPKAQLGLKDQLEVHSVERRYLALVRGHLRTSPLRVESILVRNRGDGKRGSGTSEAGDARRAVTHLKTLEKLGKASLVEARLETGRTHQVRIHLLEQGCPLLGDKLYAGAGVARLSPRLALHAAALAFTHPITEEELRFELPLADDLEVLRRALLKPRDVSQPKPRPKSRKPQKNRKKKKR